MSNTSKINEEIIDTLYLPQKEFGDDFKDVYEPAEDTMLMLDALEKDYQLGKLIINGPLICVEIGSGSGALLTTWSKFCQKINNVQQHLMIATDINYRACKTTRKCSKFFHQDRIQVIRTNLAECLVDKLGNSVDLLLFNPPYCVTDDEETSSQFFGESTDINLSWAGGSMHGRKLIDRFLYDYVPRLLSATGAAYMVALDKNNIFELERCLKEKHQIVGERRIERSSQLERLAIIRYERKGLS